MAWACINCGRPVDVKGNPLVGHEDDERPLCYDCAEDEAELGVPLIESIRRGMREVAMGEGEDLPGALLARVDEARGSMSRAAWIREAIERRL